MHSLQDPTNTPAPAHWWTATGHERPVFLDEHGRRRRWVLAAGALAGAAAALWLTALVIGAIGFSSLPSSSLPSWSAQHHQRVRRQADLAAVRVDRVRS
jgi:hypothetical protein